GDWSENVEVKSNKESVLVAVFQEMAGSISIKSIPSEAMIHIEGSEVGSTPAIVDDLSPGTHTVNILKDGYNVWSQSVKIDLIKRSELTAILQETKGSVTIKSTPADGLIFIDGKEAGTSPKTIFDIKGGTHLVEVRIDGYENWSENIEITDKEYNLIASLQEKTGSIDVQSEPSNATILINGNKVGFTPETIKNIKPGIHQIEIRADGFGNWSNNVEVTTEKKSKVTALLLKASGSINVKSSPENAKIYIDGREVGTTPTTLSSIPIGAHEIDVKIDGHEGWNKSIIIKKEKELSLNAVLQINIGSINIESYPKNAKIYIDGKEVGITPKRFTDIVVGTHEVEVLLEGYLIWKKTIKVKSEKETSITADLKKISSPLEIKTDKTTKAPEIPKLTTHKTSE
ncbi:MAG TPA: PEGA domain-containing protein, partial [Candidatus Scalindua sp.]|nr:PEGA domain-containing protein [Candidatus Scalindua sp.]